MPVESTQGWPDGEEADDKDWPGDVIWPAEPGQDMPWAGAPGAAGPGRPGEPGPPGQRRGWWPGPLASVAVVAVLAAGAGAGLTIALTGSPGTPAAAASAPAAGGSPRRVSGGVPGAPGGPASQMLLMGTVTAVSATSITIGGNGPSVTAAVTKSTRVTGQVNSIRGIKVGDQVSAQLTQSGGRVIATAIQYPAEQAGGGLP